MCRMANVIQHPASHLPVHLYILPNRTNHLWAVQAHMADQRQAHNNGLLLTVTTGSNVGQWSNCLRHQASRGVMQGRPNVICLIWANGKVTAAHAAQRVA